MERADAGLAAAEAKGDRSVLTALVGVVNHGGGPALRHGHVQRVEDELRSQVRRHRPADHAATSHIEDDGEVEEARPGRDVGNVGHPEAIRPGRREGRG